MNLFPLFYIFFIAFVIAFRFRVKLLQFFYSKISSKINVTAKPLNMSDRSKVAMHDLENGRLPRYVHDRIEKQNSGNLPWTSNLSISDWALLKAMKFRPLGMVMGCAHYHLRLSINNYVNAGQNGYRLGPGNANYSRLNNYVFDSSQELIEVENAIHHVCDLALERLKQEAKLMGAHAVVDVKIKSILPREGSHQIEYSAYGTAITLENKPLPEEPVLCTCSVTDFIKLLAAGSMPVGIGLGVGVWFKYTNVNETYQQGFWAGNTEITGFTEAVFHVRNLALKHLHSAISRQNANGVLAHQTQFELMRVEGEGNRKNHLLQFVCLGTIVEEVGPLQHPKIKMVLDITQ